MKNPVASLTAAAPPLLGLALSDLAPLRLAPPDLARSLFDVHPGPKRLWEEPGATHNTLPYRPGDSLWSEITGFLLGYTPPR